MDGTVFVGLMVEPVAQHTRDDFEQDEMPERQFDRMGGRRMVRKALGYVATVVSGWPVIENGQITAARPGRWAHGPAPQSVVRADRTDIGVERMI